MVQFKIGVRGFVGVEVPIGYDYLMRAGKLWRVSGGAYISTIPLPAGEYKIIGLADENPTLLCEAAGVLLEYADPSDFDDIRQTVEKWRNKHGITDNTLIIEKIK